MMGDPSSDPKDDRLAQSGAGGSGASDAPSNSASDGAPVEDEWIAEARREASHRKAGETKKRQPASEFIDRIGQPTVAAGPSSDHTDEALFLRYQNGDERAFFAIYERYKQSIYAYCAQVLFSAGLAREAVEDTFQDVFLRLVQYRHTFTGGDFKPWIFTVARHSCLSTKKRSFRQNASMEYAEDGEDFEDIIAGDLRATVARTDDPLEQMTKQEQNALLLSAIAKLPEEFREALILSEYEGLTYEEIGQMMGASLSTIRIRIFRAKARLRKMLLPVIGDGPKKV